MRHQFRKILSGAGTALALAVSQSAMADFIPFSCIDGNVANCSPAAASQILMDVQSVNSTTVSFTFTNIGSISSVVTQIYWDTQMLSSISIASQFGVSFSVPGNPGNFPEGQDLTPKFVEKFASKANPSPAQNGIENGLAAGDSLVVNGVLTGGQSLTTLLASFAAGTTRVGVHVQGIAPNGASDSLITGHATVVPVPGALPLMVSGLLAVGFLARRRKND